ncbi:transglutaminase-like cysteine peptidase [Endobacterium cereale]|uniref:transglutaminase-like cysteine peptidase n=1 Tax=Endobacterium cereale TaxID=2663029 RepID=UPI002B464B9A|nr:transglutaminase-like cysteine peptidase [Endobacterium cereale]MEB2848520.1 transglutaminase-like cysteine peptidase [Endobacterium cereale]
MSVVQPSVVQVAIKPAHIPTEIRRGPAAAAFDTVAVPFKRLAALKNLAPSLDEMNKGTALACRSRDCAAAVTTIKLAGTTQLSLRDKLNAVNAAVNKAITYRSDMETNGVADYWATPSETLARGQGDCEDFAILKMAALRAQGIDPEALSIVALFDQKRRLYHAVLSVEISGRHFILDNVRNQVLQDTQLPNYVALYSIRDGKGFLHGSQRQKQMASAITSLEKIAPGAGMN